MSKFASVSLVCAVFSLGVCVQLARGDDKPPEMPKPGAEHAFLKSFVGEWDCEMESFVDPGKGSKHKSTMSGKMLGDFWAVATFKGEMMGMPFTGQGNFGFDSKKKKAIGNWFDSMGDHLWTYDGKLDGKKLILDATGPSMTDPNKMIPYRDTWDFSTPDKFVLTSEFTGPDGKMTMMMRATGVRKK